jgi:hypothetical protein
MSKPNSGGGPAEERDMTDCDNCHYKQWQLKKTGLWMCFIIILGCIGGGIVTAVMGHDVAVFMSIAPIATGGILTVFGMDSFKTFCKSKWFQEDLVGK